MPACPAARPCRPARERAPVARILTPDRVEADSLQSLVDVSFDPRFGEGWSAEQVASALAMPGVRAAFAYADDDADDNTGPVTGSVTGPVTGPIGFALVRLVADEAELLLIAVRPEQRGKGTGRQLLDYAIEKCFTSGARDMFLEVRAKNIPAINLYKSRKFEVVGKRPGYYRSDKGELHDALTMHLSLSTR